jgi:hypothetical protein
LPCDVITDSPDPFADLTRHPEFGAGIALFPLQKEAVSATRIARCSRGFIMIQRIFTETRVLTGFLRRQAAGGNKKVLKRKSRKLR